MAKSTEDYDPAEILARVTARKAAAHGSLHPFVRFFSNTVRAIRYNRRQHIPPREFIRGLECKWGRAVDPASVFWFEHHAIAVDLLHQIFGGKLATGTPEVDDRVSFVFLDGMFFYTPGLTRETLNSKNAWWTIVDAFHKHYPDAAALILYAHEVYWKGSEPSTNRSCAEGTRD